MRSRILALFLSIIIVFSAVSCSHIDGDLENGTDENSEITTDSTNIKDVPKRKVDLLSKAISLSKIENKLVGMSYAYIGTGCFEDYKYLHKYPLESASYPMEISALTKRIEKDTGGVYEFCHEVMRSYGFETDFDSGAYRIFNNIGDAFEELYKQIGESSGAYSAAIAAERLTPEASVALARYISSLSIALYYNLQVTAEMSDSTYKRISDFVFCSVATSDPSALQRIKDQYTQSSEMMLIRSGLIMVKASSELIGALENIEEITVDGDPLNIETPIGNIVIGSKNNDTYNSPNAILIIDQGGDDVYNGKVAASLSKKSPISVLIDFDGDDIYTAYESDGATQGCGLFGTGLLFDLRGRDRYVAYRLAQGVAIHGLGVLFDGEGNDSYYSKITTQGAGYYGFAALIDTDGNDRYEAMATAQASAGNRAMAFLVDICGNDKYDVEPYEIKGFEFLDYGQFKDVNGNWSQGCGMGQRNINISGGIAGLIDIEGDDFYTGGIWVQGVGYWSGIGFLSDLGGNDKHRSQYYSQASVAHYGAGMLINVGGNDIHSLVEGKVDGGEGASIGFVWDRGVAMFVNDGGDDKYISEQTCCGSAWSAYDDKGPTKQDKTYAFFIETEGNDTYSKSNAPSYGYGRGGFFIDAGGKDVYEDTQRVYENVCERIADDGGVVIDGGANSQEIVTIKIWDEAKAKYFK